MAEDEQFSLCWNNFNSNLSAGFHESLIRGDLVDVTLAAEGQFVKAHRLVLSVCSPYFRKMFTQMPPNQHAFVFLKDVSHSALKDLIQFMYCGEVNVKQDALPAFIGTAEALQIKGLTDGEPGPSQSPAKPSTPAPQPAPSTAAPTITSPRIRTQRSSTTRTTYKLESEDSDNDKPTQIVIHQSQGTQSQQIVQQTQKRPAQRSITPHSGSVKRVKNTDPLEATDPTQITVQTSDAKTATEAEFIDLPIELPTKAEPDYSEDAGEVEAAEQDATYVEDDSYGDMKYDESYFTENDDGGGNTSGTGAATGSTTVKGQTGSFSESYVSDAGEQSATETQGILKTKNTIKKEIQQQLSGKKNILYQLSGGKKDMQQKLSGEKDIQQQSSGKKDMQQKLIGEKDIQQQSSGKKEIHQQLSGKKEIQQLSGKKCELTNQYCNIQQPKWQHLKQDDRGNLSVTSIIQINLTENKPVLLSKSLVGTANADNIVRRASNGHELVIIRKARLVGHCVECLKKSKNQKELQKIITYCPKCPGGPWICEKCFIEQH